MKNAVDDYEWHPMETAPKDGTEIHFKARFDGGAGLVPGVRWNGTNWERTLGTVPVSELDVIGWAYPNDFWRKMNEITSRSADR